MPSHALSNSDCRRSATSTPVDGSAWQPDYAVRWLHADDGAGVARWQCDGRRSPVASAEEVPRFIEINLQTRGAHVRTSGRQAYLVEPLQQSLWPSGTGFRLSGNVGRPQSATLVFVLPETLDGALSGIAGARANTLQRLLARPATIRSDAVAIAHARLLAHDDALARGEAVLGLLRDFLAATLGSTDHRGPSAAAETSAVRRGIAFVASHYREPLTLRRIAAEAGLSGSRFSALFARQVGLPVWRYVKNLRLQDALSALATARDGDLATLALDLGFNSHSHFATAFRGRYGLTPTAFRQDRSRDAQVATRR